MSRNTDFDVRGHSQEREWLLTLGGGNIIEGVRNLIEDLKDKGPAKDDDDYYYSESKRRKFFKWRD